MKHPALVRLAMLMLLVLVLEILCARGVIDRLTMQPPHVMALDLGRMLVSGRLDAAILRTFGNVAAAFVAAMLTGVAAALLLHRLPSVRAALDPLFATWYAVPVFAFYPLLIIVFGLGALPEIAIGFMLAVIAVVVAVLAGLDHVPGVLRRVSRVLGLGAWERAWQVTLPCIAPHLLTAARLALAYALIGVIGAEFIMATSGVGYEISDAYNNFDNATMYPLILLIVIASVAINALLGRWERRLMARRGFG